MDSRVKVRHGGPSIKGHVPLMIHAFLICKWHGPLSQSVFLSLPPLIRGNRWIILTSLGRFLNHANEVFHDLRRARVTTTHLFIRDESVYGKPLATRGFAVKNLEKVIKRSVLRAPRNPGSKRAKMSRRHRSSPRDKFFHLLDTI